MTSTKGSVSGANRLRRSGPAGGLAASIDGCQSATLTHPALRTRFGSSTRFAFAHSAPSIIALSPLLFNRFASRAATRRGEGLASPPKAYRDSIAPRGGDAPLLKGHDCSFVSFSAKNLLSGGIRHNLKCAQRAKGAFGVHGRGHSDSNPVTKISALDVSFSQKNLLSGPPKVGGGSFIPMEYTLDSFQRSNQDTCITHKPAVFEGDWVQSGDVLTDCASSVGGELSLGQNLLIAYLPWEGYNFEDAILISERLVIDDLYTSVHIERYEMEVNQTNLGPEEITRDIPDVSDADVDKLDSFGIVKMGSWVEEGDILVGKITPIQKNTISPYQKLLYTILEKKVRPFRDSSLRAPKGVKAKVIDIKYFNKAAPSSPPLSAEGKKLESLLKDGSSKGRSTPPLKSAKTKVLNPKEANSLQKRKNELDLPQKRSVTTIRQAERAEGAFGGGYSLTKQPLLNSLNNYFSTRKKRTSPRLPNTADEHNPFEQINPMLGGQNRMNKPFAFPPAIGSDQSIQNHPSVASSMKAPKVFTLGGGATGGKKQKTKKFKNVFCFWMVGPLGRVAAGRTTHVEQFQENKSTTPKGSKRFAASPQAPSAQKNKDLTPSPNCGPKGLRVTGLQKATSSTGSKPGRPKLTKTNILKYTTNTSEANHAMGPQGAALLKLRNIETIHIYLAETRKIQVGDKMSGRHGNKGIVSQILPIQDMPYLPDGTPIDMVLNPLGVPSRMNVGQIYECLLGLAGRYLGENYKVSCFDEIYGPDASRSFVFNKLYEASNTTGSKWLFDPNTPGKVRIYDGRTGDSFDQAVTVGHAYILRLVHMVDDKIHMRSTGPYSLVTQQPLRGRSKEGGQRLGEMEVWALEGYGAAFTLLEMLTIKSDDMTGRMTLWSNLILNKDISIGTPESFKVLICELQALCLDIGLFRYGTNSEENRSGPSQLTEIDSLINLP
jgi:DNA-directed RNA polymerase beta subunit